MPNQYINKVQFGDQTVMDITDTSANAQNVLEGEVFYNAAGARTVGALGDATQSTHGLMSAADKQKLDTIIDDTADSTSTTSTWSAAKVAQELAAAVPTSISDLTDDSDFLTNTEFEALIGANSGLATLDSSGKVPSSQLPSYVDDVLEYSDSTNFPATGEASKIYVDTTSNKTYRWGGSEYVEISESLALGETDSTAYRGDRGKVAYDHAAAKGSAYTSGLYKITTNAEGHVTAAEAVTKTDIIGLGIPAQDTTYQSLAAAENGTDISLVSTGEKYTWNNKLSKNGGTIGGSLTIQGTLINNGIVSADDDIARPVWFAAAENNSVIVGRPVYNNDFKYNPYTNTLTLGAGTLSATNYNGTAAKATADADGNTISSTYLKLSGGTVTGATTIKNILTLYRESSTTDNSPAGIVFSTKDTTVSKAHTNAYIYAYHDHSSTNGANMVIHPGGNLFVGSGESAANLYPTYKASTGEDLFITSDRTAYMYANAQTIANRIGFALTTAGAIVPQKAEAANNNAQTLGVSGNAWSNIYATTHTGTTGTFSGTVSAKTFTITSTTAEAHLNFSRAGYNYINVPTSGALGVTVGGQSASNLQFAVEAGKVYCYADSRSDLGTAEANWKSTHSKVYVVSEKVTLQWNSTDSSLDFVFI